MRRQFTIAPALAALIAGLASPALAKPAVPGADAESRAAATVKAMTTEEKTVMTHGILPISMFTGNPVPADAVPAAGYVAGIPRLDVPSLKETGASLGVA